MSYDRQKRKWLFTKFSKVWSKAIVIGSPVKLKTLRYQIRLHAMLANCDGLRVYISSSSCHAISTDIPDPLSPPLPIVHRFRWVLRAIPRILTELLYIGSSWPRCFCTAMWRGPKEYITNELVPTSPAVSCMSGSSNLDSFRDER